MIRESPIVSVLMAAHNAEPYLQKAVASVLAQSLTDFELILVDDASTDRTAGIIGSFDDDRIVAIRNDENLGAQRSRNRGLATARGQYVAVLDADDIAERRRLEAQVAYLDQRPEVAVLASWVTFIDGAGRIIEGDGPYVGRASVYPDPAVIDWELCWGSPIWHSSVMMRRSALLAVGGYADHYNAAHDYDLWTRMRMAGGTIHMMPERLVQWRRNSAQLSSKRGVEQERNALEIASRFASWISGERIDPEEIRRFRDLVWTTTNTGHLSDPMSALRLARMLRDCLSRSPAADDAFQLERWCAELIRASALRHLGSKPRTSCALMIGGIRAGLIRASDPSTIRLMAKVAGRLSAKALDRIRIMARPAIRLARRSQHVARARFSYLRKYPFLRLRLSRLRAEMPGRRFLAIDLVGFLGDAIACEPMIGHVRQNDPDVFIVWFANEAFCELFDAHPGIDMTIPVSCFTERIDLAKSGLFDEVISPYFRESTCLTCRVEDPSLPETEGLDLSNYYNYGNLLETYCRRSGLPPLKEGPRLYPTPSAVDRVDRLGLPANFVVIHALSTENARNWVAGKWVELVARLNDELGIAVVEIGQRSMAAGGSSYVDLCGSLSIAETAEVIRRAALFVGIDSGPAHLANAFGTPGVILLGHFRSFVFHLPYSGSYADGSNATLIHHDGPSSEIAVSVVFRSVVERLSMNTSKTEARSSIRHRPRGGAGSSSYQDIGRPDRPFGTGG